ncbi:MAG: four helix bundle protein [Acidobacteria bacterium]|nr:four helix bundle protein [Acidobacteriota bacterium]
MNDELRTQKEEPKAAPDIHDRTFDFACRIVRLYEALRRKAGPGRAISTQLLKSGTSIGANLEEARGGQSRADFASKCCIALKEARESHYWLRIVDACGILPLQSIRPLVNEANEIVAILTTIVKRTSVR